MNEVLDSPDDLRVLESALVTVVKRVIGKPLQGVPGAHQVERAGYLTLVRLEACGETRLSDLAAALELDLSTVSRQVRVLTDLDLVARRPDPDDGRASRLDLTDAGRSELAVLRRERHRLLGRALDGWTAEDRRRLIALLDRLAADLGGSPDAACRVAALAVPARAAHV